MACRSCAPSSAERWANCPRSVALSEDAPDQEGSWHAARGHVLHFAASRALPEALKFDAGFCVGVAAALISDGVSGYRDECAAVGYKPTKEDAEAVEWAVLNAVEIIGEDAIRVDLEVVFPPPIWLPMRRGPTIDVYYVRFDGTHGIIDYKFGRKPVATACPQMMIYADAVFEAQPNVHDFLELTIVQPPNAFETVTVSRTGVREECKKFIMAAVDVQLTAATDNPADYNPGSWCFFCPAKGICPAHRDKAKQQALTTFANLIEKD